MAINVNVKIYSKMSANELTKEFTAEDGKLDTGSLNACAAALSAALFQKAVSLLPQQDSERTLWLIRNGEILRAYFVHMIDDDPKARKGYLKELAEGNEDNAEAAMHPACAINEEVINMLHQMLELLVEVKNALPEESRHYAVESAQLALGAIKSARSWLLNLTSHSLDETYRFVVRRENELTMESVMKLYEEIVDG